MSSRPRILLVDPLEETREVLRSALEARGMELFSASRAADGLRLARDAQPDLIVLDLELSEVEPEELAAGFAAASGERTSLVLLGEATTHVSPSPGELVAKPYHYAPLIRRIEALLATRQVA